jgi:hypothetical protein
VSIITQADDEKKDKRTIRRRNDQTSSSEVYFMVIAFPAPDKYHRGKKQERQRSIYIFKQFYQGLDTLTAVPMV